jgi:hypothetical protein
MTIRLLPLCCCCCCCSPATAHATNPAIPSLVTLPCFPIGFMSSSASSHRSHMTAVAATAAAQVVHGTENNQPHSSFTLRNLTNDPSSTGDPARHMPRGLELNPSTVRITQAGPRAKCCHAHWAVMFFFNALTTIRSLPSMLGHVQPY